MAITVMHGHTTNALVGRGVNCSLATLLRLQPFHLSCGDSLTHTLNSWHPFIFTIPDVSVRHFSAAIPFITFLFGGSSPHHPYLAPWQLKLQPARWQIQFVPNVLLQKPGIIFIFLVRPHVCTEQRITQSTNRVTCCGGFVVYGYFNYFMVIIFNI